MDRTIPRELVALQRRVEAWRGRDGGRGCRIPEELWREAVEVVRTAGLYATARALRFNYEGLKKRAAKSAVRESGNKAAFVALQVPAFNGGARVVVDLVGRDGEQVRIDWVGASGMDVVAFAQAFWGCRP